VAVHVVPVEDAVELVLVEDEELDELDELVLEIDVEVEVGLGELEDDDVDTPAVKRHEQAVDTLVGRFEHWVA
jgi:hypothetical protein